MALSSACRYGPSSAALFKGENQLGGTVRRSPWLLTRAREPTLKQAERPVAPDAQCSQGALLKSTVAHFTCLAGEPRPLFGKSVAGPLILAANIEASGRPSYNMSCHHHHSHSLQTHPHSFHSACRAPITARTVHGYTTSSNKARPPPRRSVYRLLLTRSPTTHSFSSFFTKSHRPGVQLASDKLSFSIGMSCIHCVYICLACATQC
jgi:hypothetical protein